MKTFRSIWELTPEQQVDVIKGKLVCNITPEAILALHYNTAGLDKRHTVETYSYLLTNGEHAFKKRYITKFGQWRVNALRDGIPMHQWGLEDVLAVVRGDFGIVDSPTSDNFNSKLVIKRATGLPVEQWHPKDIIAYAQTYHLENGPVEPRVTMRGNAVRSLRYMILAPGEWTRSEQLDGLDGNLTKHKEFDYDSIIESVREHSSLPLEWSSDEVYEFLSNDVYPPKTSNGLWVNDVNREFISLEHLPLNYMQAFLLEEISLPFTKAEICDEYRRRRGVVSLDDFIIITQVRTMTRKSAPTTVAFVTDMLEGFTGYMQKANGRNSAVAAEAHHTMYSLITKIVRMDYVEYNEAMGLVLDYIYRNTTGIFAPHRVFGGITDIKLTPKQFAFYEQYMNLLLKTANPATRFTAANETSLVELTKVSPATDIADKIRNFYKLDV